MWLLNKLFESQDHPNPRFSFLGTVYWMKALAFLVKGDNFAEKIEHLYSPLGQKSRNEYEKSIVWENLVFSLHNIAFLKSLIGTNGNYNSVRAALISWYYSIYYSASAMITSASGSNQESHSKTINVFQNQIIDNNLAVGPFQFTLRDITSHSIDTQINNLRNGNEFNLNTTPDNEMKALGCLYSYLKGTAQYQQDIVIEKIKKGNEFKSLGVTNFRTRVARELRDRSLSNHKINFLTQAYRYRGKANYRDSIYLSYGEDNSELITNFINDMEVVAKKFFLMAFALVNKCLPQNEMEEFVLDLKTNLRFDIDNDLIEL